MHILQLGADFACYVLHIDANGFFAAINLFLYFNTHEKHVKTFIKTTEAKVERFLPRKLILFIDLVILFDARKK